MWKKREAKQKANDSLMNHMKGARFLVCSFWCALEINGLADRLASRDGAGKSAAASSHPSHLLHLPARISQKLCVNSAAFLCCARARRLGGTARFAPVAAATDALEPSARAHLIFPAQIVSSLLPAISRVLMFRAFDRAQTCRRRLLKIKKKFCIQSRCIMKKYFLEFLLFL